MKIQRITGGLCLHLHLHLRLHLHGAKQIPKNTESIKAVAKREGKWRKLHSNVVSIGPYHHGKPELQNCYERNCIKSYSDDELVRMMLLDACFIIIYIETSCIEGRPQSAHEKMIASNADNMFQKLGISIMSTVLRDMFLLENQIPLQIIKLLLESRYNGNQLGEELLHSDCQHRHMNLLTASLFEDFQAKRKLPPGHHQEELYLHEAFRRLVIFGFVHETKETCLGFINRKFFYCFEAEERTVGDSNIDSDSDVESGVSSLGKSRFQSRMNYLTAGASGKLFKNVHNEGDNARSDKLKFVNLFHSVTDLKPASIRFKPNQTLSLKDVTFESYCIFGKLQLPFWFVSTHTKVFFMNMIAYQFNPGKFRPDKFFVTAHINLMKSLIVRPEDAKELHKIQAHCNGKAKRWIPELINTYFRSPWSFIALVATTYFLVLTTLQTIYTMKF
ncbi:hypothetical protein CDL12_10936 [Handroanthus impetiginosus]|uniref:Uncharacterized protein n=1 Tax=Handroanthus impetiginosus TaxID=429701 RepID=A0A2G9HFT4_9LAMI|nr:hypothetical protein CDL12_10936 [Handroanthus impetiginosus]